MSRLPLIHIPNGFYSVVSKCNNNEFLFNAHEKFELYIQHVTDCKEKLGFKLYDICCMSNHVHELYQVPENVTIADILKRVKGQFSIIHNKRFGRTGHFWRNKPFYRIIENETYAIHTMHYFHMNPVKAGMVIAPAHWPYSGYRFHVLNERLGPLAKLLTPISGFKCEPDQTIQKRVDFFVNNDRARFIGENDYIINMRKTYGEAKRIVRLYGLPQVSDT